MDLRHAWSIALALVVMACDGSADLVVTLRTDLLPGIEFFSVEAEVEGIDGTQRTTTAVIGDGYVDGVRVAEYTALQEGTHTVRVVVFDAAGVPVASSRLRFVHTSRPSAITVLLTRDCNGLDCPSGDPALAACYGGMCADPTCATGAEEECPPPECDNAADCPDPGACSIAACVGGICFYRGQDALCAVDEFCRPQGSCEPLPVGMDSGLPDGGLPDGAGIDGGDLDAASSCDDGMRNGTESDVDCGGACPACADGRMCRGRADCMSEVCEAGICIACVVDATCDLALACTSGIQACFPMPMCELGTPTASGVSCGPGRCDGTGVCEVTPAYATITPGSGVSGMRFGSMLELEGTRLVVAAPEDTNGAVLLSGSVSIYERPATLWSFVTRLTVARNGGTSAPIQFGTGISLSGDRLAVGAINSIDDMGFTGGVVEVFDRQPGGAWMRDTLLERDFVPREGNFLGNGVAIEGNRVVGGAPGRDVLPTGMTTSAGTAWVYQEAAGTWTRDFELERPAPASYDFYGNAIAMEGDTVVIGAHVVTPPRDAAGFASVQTFDGSAWTERSRLTSLGGLANDDFGISVDIDGDWILVGAPQSGADFGGRTGAAYAYRRQPDGSWIVTQELLPIDAEGLARFGHCARLDGDLAVIGAHGGTGGGVTGAGTAYVFRRNVDDRWLPIARLSAPAGEAGARFGIGCAISGTTVAIGADRDDASGTTDAGAVYIYELAGI